MIGELWVMYERGKALGYEKLAVAVGRASS